LLVRPFHRLSFHGDRPCRSSAPCGRRCPSGSRRAGGSTGVPARSGSWGPQRSWTVPHPEGMISCETECLRFARARRAVGPASGARPEPCALPSILPDGVRWLHACCVIQLQAKERDGSRDKSPTALRDDLVPGGGSAPCMARVAADRGRPMLTLGVTAGHGIVPGPRSPSLGWPASAAYPPAIPSPRFRHRRQQNHAASVMAFSRRGHCCGTWPAPGARAACRVRGDRRLSSRDSGSLVQPSPVTASHRPAKVSSWGEQRGVVR